MTFPDPAIYEFPEWIVLGDYAYFAREVVSFGDPLTVKNLREAYTKGIFPWHMDGIPLPWYCPEKRAILDFADLHIPKSLERARRRNEFRFTIDKAFRSVIEECSRTRRPGQRGTWITSEFIETYSALHTEGIAHSVEVWDLDEELVGGVYGVDAGGVFCGESMFFKKPNASKLALLFLFDHLLSCGSSWFDAQVMTPHIKALGAKEIEREQFLRRLRETQGQHLLLFLTMGNDAALREHLLELLKGEFAHISLEHALRDFPVEHISARINGSPHTAWQLLEHIRLAQWDILDFSRNPDYTELTFPDDYWPKDEGTPETWKNSVEQVLDDLQSMRELVKDSDVFAQIPHGDGQTILREAMLVADHNAYHLGQIVLISRMLETKK